NAADDELVYSTTRTLFEQVENYTRSTGQHVPFIYMNYALPTQKVIESYGQENVNFLRAVSRKYDPKQVFQRLVPGGFKLWPRKNMYTFACATSTAVDPEARYSSTNFLRLAVTYISFVEGK
ncbi:MAG: hypothetical protein Q9198_006768, partial [Flavoplaca austrocitrina]